MLTGPEEPAKSKNSQPLRWPIRRESPDAGGTENTKELILTSGSESGSTLLCEKAEKPEVTPTIKIEKRCVYRIQSIASI